MRNDTTAPVRLAVAGAGLIGRRHAELIRDSTDCTLVGLADPAPAAATTAATFGVPLWRDLRTLLREARPDGVILSTPNALHVPQALECIDHRVPVLVEKPVADTFEAAQRLVGAAERSGVPVLIGHHRRHSAIIEVARAVIASGRLGRIVAVNGSATFRKPDSYFAEAPWRRQTGGGPMLINLIHDIDNLRVLVGEIVEVQALGANVARGFEVEDTVAIGLRFANGALGTFLLSDAAASPRSWEQTTGEDQSYDWHPGEDCYVIAGGRGSLEVPTMRLRTHAGECSWRARLEVEVVSVPAAVPLRRQLTHFCAMIRQGEVPHVSARDAAKTLQVTLAVAEAARTGARVLLNGE